MLMVRLVANRISFQDFAGECGVSVDALYASLGEYRRDIAPEPITLRQLQQIKSDGITRQKGKTRDFLIAFLRSPKASELKISSEEAERFLDGHRNAAQTTSDHPMMALVKSDPEIFRTIMGLLAIRRENGVLKSARTHYAGDYYLVRKTSRDKGKHYYEEPFHLGNQGAQSFLIPYKQDVQFGFSLGSSGSCTSILFNRHHERVIGVCVVMLYARNDPESDLMTGIMLRFSDDTARPFACQILARRVHDQEKAGSWRRAVEEITKLVAARPDASETRAALNAARDYARRVDPEGAMSDLHSIYAALKLNNQAKAFSPDDWDETLQEARLSEEALVARLRE